jgi:hypothetical protein
MAFVPQVCWRPAFQIRLHARLHRSAVRLDAVALQEIGDVASSVALKAVMRALSMAWRPLGRSQVCPQEG